MSFSSTVLPLASVFSKGGPGYLSLKDDGECQQYGRSPSSLAAEVASAALRPIGSYKNRTRPLHSRKTFSQSTTLTESSDGHVIVTVDSVPRIAPLKQQPSLTSEVPDLLRPPISIDVLKKRASKGFEKRHSRLSQSLSLSQRRRDYVPLEDVEEKSPRSPQKDAPQQAEPPRKARGRSRTKRPSVPVAHCENSPARPSKHSPLKVTDLGQDYTRYPSTKLFLDAIHNAPIEKPTLAERLEKRWQRSHSRGTSPGNCRNRSREKSREKSRESSRTRAKRFFFPFLDDRIGAPSLAENGYSFPMYLNEKEQDDELHAPCGDDDIKDKPRKRDYVLRGQMCSLVGLAFMFCGLLVTFIIVPILSDRGDVAGNIGPPNAIIYNNPNQFNWDYINDRNYSLFQNMRTGLIDPTTPSHALTRRAVDGSTLKLIFSDEFNTPGRSFYPGDDPYWTAPDLWYGSTQDLEWYDPDAANTASGTLNLQMDNFQNHNLNYRSGMLQSWNQACFKGGALEVSVSLAGPAGVQGLWPGAWTMGNLGRPGYQSTTDGTWPYTYDSCDAGITPNQSDPSGLSQLPGQRLPACTCAGEDHPSPGRGRGAPEIDVFEASANGGADLGVITQSYQVAPFDIFWRPNYDYLAIRDENVTAMNAYCGSAYQQAISSTTTLNHAWYDGAQYQKYAFEYRPGAGADAEIAWFVGDDVNLVLNGNAIGPNGNVARRLVSEEPMSIVLNLGLSNSWTSIDWDRLRFPATMRVDYVRWYQREGEEMATCDPPGWETTKYIEEHPRAYLNPNLTTWDDTGYGWPKHQLNSQC